MIRQRRGAKHEHLEQFNCSSAESLARETLGLTHRFCKLVAIRSPYSMSMLEKALEETDPETTDLVVMTARLTGGDDAFASACGSDRLRPAAHDSRSAKGRAGGQTGHATHRAHEQPSACGTSGRLAD